MLELTETLNCGGTLRVDLKGWRITYFIQGPDRRYNPKFYTVEGSTIDRYISVLKKNFAEYERLKVALANEESFSKHLDMGMSIHMVNKVPSFNGLHLGSHTQPISTAFQLEKLTDNYLKASERAMKMQILLSSL